jgi:phosphopantetheine adenylyltransferase
MPIKQFKSFGQFVEAAIKTVVITYGRFNPPTIGHGVLLDKLASIASTNKFTYQVHVSQSLDPKKNPLQYVEKVKILRKMFPKHARSIILNAKAKTIFDVVLQISKNGFTRLILVVGSDRIADFTKLLNKYNGVTLANGELYNFVDGITVISAGNRDPDADGAEGMSASKMRLAAAENNFIDFKLGLPKAFSAADSQELFNLVRKRMGLKEVNSFWQHTKLENISEVRNKFIRGEIFLLGNRARVIKTGEEVIIVQRGSNYVVTEGVTSLKQIKRRWLTDLIAIDNKSSLG